MEAFFRGSHTTNSVTCGLSKSYNQAAQVPSSNVTCKSPRSPSINCRITLVFVSITHSITIFPASFLTAIEMLSLCTSIPIYFLSFNMRVLLSVGVDANDQNLLQRGALLYCVTLSVCGFLPLDGVGQLLRIAFISRVNTNGHKWTSDLELVLGGNYSEGRVLHDTERSHSQNA